MDNLPDGAVERLRPRRVLIPGSLMDRRGFHYVTDHEVEILQPDNSKYISWIQCCSSPTSGFPFTLTGNSRLRLHRFPDKQEMRN